MQVLMRPWGAMHYRVDGPVAGAPVILANSLGVAAMRPDLIRGLVLSNTAAKLGTVDGWQARIDAVVDGGIPSIADAVLDRWFGPRFRASPAVAPWRNMLIRTPARGYAAACAALGQADQTAATRTLRLPTLVIAGAAFHHIPEVGHLPCVENPTAFVGRYGRHAFDDGPSRARSARSLGADAGAGRSWGQLARRT